MGLRILEAKKEVGPATISPSANSRWCDELLCLSHDVLLGSRDRVYMGVCIFYDVEFDFWGIRARVFYINNAQWVIPLLRANVFNVECFLKLRAISSISCL